MSHTPLQSEPGYPAAVAEESRSHADVTHERLAAEYRDLVWNCTQTAPDFRDYELTDLPDLDAEDLALIQRAKGLTETNTLRDAQQALLEDVIRECEVINERRAEARDQRAFERYHGGDTPFDERERLMSELGLRERDFR